MTSDGFTFGKTRNGQDRNDRHCPCVEAWSEYWC